MVKQTTSLQPFQPTICIPRHRNKFIVYLSACGVIASLAQLQVIIVVQSKAILHIFDEFANFDELLDVSKLICLLGAKHWKAID